MISVYHQHRELADQVHALSQHKDLVKGFQKEKHFGFEEIAYLLLFGELPDKEEFDKFYDTLIERRTLNSG